MGTSVNQRSPDTDNWRIVQDVYKDPSLTAAQSLRSLWRAASNSKESNLAANIKDLAIPRLAEAAMASDGFSAESAQEVLRREVSESRASSLAVDIAVRAACLSADEKDFRNEFVVNLFAEATGYLVSRDIYGHVGKSEKLKTLGDAKNFLAQLRQTTKEVVSPVFQGSQVSTDNWTELVDQAVQAIRRAE